VFVLTRSEPADPAPGHARYVTDLEACVAEAKAAAGGRDVMVHGAATAQSMLRAGLLDELAIQMMPLLLEQGRRLFDDLPPELHELELLRSLEGPGVLHLRYRVGTAS
jgi:dihydrofolate reductase